MSQSKSLIANVFFLAVLFPFISPVPTPFDTQPYALLAALVLIAAAVYSGQMKLPLLLWLLGVPALYAIGLLWQHGLPNLAGLRAVSGYLSIFAIAAATYIWAHHLKIGLFAFAVYTWLAVALIQLFIYRDFGKWILPRFEPDRGSYRGVASLAAEPSHYSVVCLFFLLLNELFYSYRLYSKKQYLILMAILFFQMLMSFSGTGFVLIVSFISLKLTIMVVTRVSSKSLFRAFVTLLFVFTLTSLVLRNGYVGSTRAVSLVRIALDNPTLLLRDQSIRSRTDHLRLSMVGFYRSQGTGFGLASWTPNLVALNSGSTLVRFPTPGGERILSGWGTALFELGVFGLGLIIVVSSVMIQGIHRHRSRGGLYLLVLASMHLVLINTTPVAFPPFAFLIALCAVFYGNRGRYGRPQ